MAAAVDGRAMTKSARTWRRSHTARKPSFSPSLSMSFPRRSDVTWFAGDPFKTTKCALEPNLSPDISFVLLLLGDCADFLEGRRGDFSCPLLSQPPELAEVDVLERLRGLGLVELLPPPAGADAADFSGFGECAPEEGRAGLEEPPSPSSFPVPKALASFLLHAALASWPRSLTYLTLPRAPSSSSTTTTLQAAAFKKVTASRQDSWTQAPTKLLSGTTFSIGFVRAFFSSSGLNLRPLGSFPCLETMVRISASIAC
mmetsp:Transcript_30975/g.61399  ORF Transcript_30975/g.61399 Transcript_30975/m.61399 type:complete len:257 (-) Transcript_30975:520-1290(-)